MEELVLYVSVVGAEDSLGFTSVISATSEVEDNSWGGFAWGDVGFTSIIAPISMSEETEVSWGGAAWGEE